MTEKNEKNWSRRGALTGLAAAVGAAGAVPLLGYPTSRAGPLAKDGGPPIEGVKSRQAKLTGRIVRPGDPGYASASLGWDELFVHHPLVIVFAQQTQDVVNALTWARQNDVAPRVRSGRHHLEGWSNVDNGIVIDVSELKSVHIDTASRVATVGAGLDQGEAVAALSAKNLGVTTGTEASVGLAGATLGGGFGFLTRYLGMACDNLIGAEIVVPSGADGAKAIKVDLGHHPDLLWALRGAGNGNFGIVTSLTYKVTPLKEVAYLQATWKGLNDLQGIFDTWQRTAPFATNRLGTQLEVHKPEILLFGVLVAGTEAEVKKLLARILSVGNPTVTVKVGGWGDIYAGFQIPTPQEPADWKFYSQFITKPYPKQAIGVVRAFMEDAPSDNSNYFTQAFGTGAQAREPRGGSAYPHRNVLFYAEPGAGWGTRGKPDSGDAITPKAQAWIAEFSQALRPYVNGAYVNVPNIAMADWETAYWGSNFSRLRKIKTTYDPHNVFRYEQSVPPL